MKRFEIIVKVNGTNYYLDTTDSDGISINYSISDIVDISTRNFIFYKDHNFCLRQRIIEKYSIHIRFEFWWYFIQSE